MTQTTNKHGFEVKREFELGGIAFTVIQTEAERVKVIASNTIEERAFDNGNKNDFATSELREYLNGEFFARLINAGAPEEMFEEFKIDLTADDGLTNYGINRARIGLITCNEYRALRENIPPLSDKWWWTATPDSTVNSFICTLGRRDRWSATEVTAETGGVRPLCVLKSEVLASYLSSGLKIERARKRPQIKFRESGSVHMVCRNY